MTKQDYQLIAQILKATRPDDDRDEELPKGKSQRECWEFTAQALASRLESTNPRLDRAKFLKACGI